MVDDARKTAQTRRYVAARDAALVVLLGRLGGRASYTEAEYQEIAARYGGTANTAIHVDITRTGDQPPVVELTLIRKAPQNAELVS